MYTMTVGLILFGLALGIALFYAISQLDERQTVRSSIRQLEDYGHGSGVETERDRELLQPARRAPERRFSMSGSWVVNLR